MSNRRWRAVSAAVLLVLGAPVALAWPATADPAKRTSDVIVDFYDPGLARAQNPGLDCVPDKQGVCSFGYDGVTTMRGSWTGSTTYRTRGYLDRTTGEVHFEVWETFTGTVEGCGRGTFDWYGTGSAPMYKLDPITQTYPFYVRLRLVDGSGTGDLMGIAGSAAGQARATVTAEQHGHLTGQVTCSASADVRGSRNDRPAGGADRRRAGDPLPRTG